MCSIEITQITPKGMKKREPQEIKFLGPLLGAARRERICILSDQGAVIETS
jgi:hypothetical protein